MHNDRQASRPRQHLARLLAGTVALACAGVMPATQAGAATVPSQGTPSATGSVHQTKPGIVRNGTWFLRDTPTAGAATVPAFQYGDPLDHHLMGDWDGNGTSTPAVWRNGVFYLRNANTTGNADIVVHYGNPDDLPIVGDWNGDGTDTIGARRGSEFFLRNTNTTGNADLQYQFGNGGELPIVGDWNGTGGDKPGVYRVSYNPATQDVTHQVFMRTTHSTGIADLPPVEIPPTDEGSPYPMVADFDANGTEDVNSYNYNSGIWYTPTIGSFAYGNPDDVDSPVTWGTRS